MRAVTQDRGVPTRPSTDEVLSPQAAREAKIRQLFTEQKRLLVQLFPKDGETLVARAVSSAIMASRTLPLSIPADLIAEKVIAAHHMGVEIGPEAYLVPYGGDEERSGPSLQLILGPRALIALMYRSGFVKSVEARAVFDGDIFEYELGDTPRIRHVKAESGRRDGAIVAAYFIAHTTTGGIVREVLTREDIDFYRSFSKAKKGPWYDNFEGMVRKTAIHRGAEFIPRSPLMSAALRQNEQGGIEVSDEILAMLRAKPEAEVLVPETVTVGAAAREPGEEG